MTLKVEFQHHQQSGAQIFRDWSLSDAKSRPMYELLSSPPPVAWGDALGLSSPLLDSASQDWKDCEIRDGGGSCSREDFPLTSWQVKIIPKDFRPQKAKSKRQETQ